MGTYSLEHAKSGRSKCRKCKEPIAKGGLRIGTHTQNPSNEDIVFDHWHHPECFVFPKKLTMEGIDVEAFVEDMLEDNTEDQLLQNTAGKEQILADIHSTPDKNAKTEDAEDTAMARIKAYLKHERDGDDNDGPAKKKIKLEANDKAMVDTYVQYHKMKADDLKDILGWNRQIKSGNKDIQLARVIDGHMHGRLGRCPVCSKGQLQLLNANADTVICKGYFDEDLSSRIPCSYSGPALDAPRLVPWFTEEPSEQEKAELDRLQEEIKSGGAGALAAASPSVKTAAAGLMQKAATLDWNISSTSKIKKATADLVDLVVQDSTLDLPQDLGRARMAVGSIIAADRSMSATQAMQAVVDKFGFAESKKVAAADKQAAMEHVCTCPENATLLSLFHELGDLYFKQGNRNAGGSYRKAEKAIKELSYEITAENALGLGKGKTKVPNIGKGSAEKMHEYLTTGRIEKLEAKRAEVS